MGPDRTSRLRTLGRRFGAVPAFALLLLVPSGLILTSCGGGGHCGSRDLSSRIILESAALVTIPGDTCIVEGTVLNTSDVEAFIELTFDAFDLNGTRFAQATAFPILPAGGRARYSAEFVGSSFSFPKCSEISRFQVTGVTATDKLCLGGIGGIL